MRRSFDFEEVPWPAAFSVLLLAAVHDLFKQHHRGVVLPFQSEVWGLFNGYFHKKKINGMEVMAQLHEVYTLTIHSVEYAAITSRFSKLAWGREGSDR